LLQGATDGKERMSHKDVTEPDKSRNYKNTPKSLLMSGPDNEGRKVEGKIQRQQTEMNSITYRKEAWKYVSIINGRSNPSFIW